MTVAFQTKGIEYVHCNLCGADDPELLYEAPVRPHRVGVYNRDVWDVVRCRRCGLIYVNPRIDAEARAALYSFRMPGDEPLIRTWFLDNADLQRPLWQRFLRVLRSSCPSGRLLDVGCGAGTFLVEARELSYEVFGQEVADYFVEHCRTEHGLTIHADFLENLDLPDDSFDVVTAFDVIEHLPDPRAFVRQVRRLLKPGGVVMISTHDIGNLFARFYGVRWRYLHPIGHITYFTRETLGRLLNENGFRVLRVGGIHTIDDSRWAESLNKVKQFARVIVLRSIVIGLYKPLARHMPFLTRWRVRLGDGVLSHEKLLRRAGTQIVMDDDLVILAAAV